MTDNNTNDEGKYSFEGKIVKTGSSKGVYIPFECPFPVGSEVYVDVYTKETNYKLFLSGNNKTLKNEEQIKDTFRKIEEPFSKEYGKIKLMNVSRVDNSYGSNYLLDVKYENDRGYRGDKWQLQSAVLGLLNKESTRKRGEKE